MKNRAERIQELLKKELGQIILREVEMPDDVLVTLTRVMVSGNLQEAKVFISVVPDTRAPEVMKTLGQNVYPIQQIWNGRLKMRPVPRIRWTAETAGAEAHRIEELLEQLKEEG